MKNYASAVFLVSFLTIRFAATNKSHVDITLEEYCLQTNSVRIIGAKNASTGAFPYQASLRDKSRRHFCGGSIVNNRWILTAAHCLMNVRNEDLIIVVGSNKLNVGGTTYKSSKVIIHQNFSLINELNDIGLIKVNETIIFNNFTKPIKLQKRDNERDWAGYPAVVTGWGFTSRGGPLSNHLQYLVNCIPDQKVCTENVAVVNFFQKICMVNRSGQGICQGDSGGPLVVNNTQVGLVSNHIVMCAFGFPDYYTRISYYSEWINQQLTG